MPEEGVTRREALRRVGLGGAVFLGGSILGHTVQHAHAATGSDGSYESFEDEEHPAMATGEDIYGMTHSAPAGLDAGALDSHTFPPAPDGLAPGATREFEIEVADRLIEVADGVMFEAWTYNGSVPAPILRATEGDLLRINFRNRTGHPHSIHFHGSHRPEEDGWEPVPPGSEVTYEIVAGPAGVHPYHCHTAPLAEHISRGLYGMLIVDPPGGRAPAREVALVISGFSNDEIGRNGVVAWNGVSGYYHLYPIKVTTGEPVRAYIVNMLEYEPVASFHLHAEVFDVYPAGIGTEPAFRDDTIVLGMGQRAMIEFTLPSLGRYMFHPHQHWLADRGAMGWFAAI